MKVFRGRKHVSNPANLIEGAAETVSAEAVRKELARVLASPQFTSSGRLSDFLRHIVEEKLAGRGDQIKESLVGVAVYGKRPDYDPKTDATVRNDALRLRSRLREYYTAEGQDSQLRIEMPKGRYVPAFEPKQPAASAPPAAVASRRPRWPLAFAIAVIPLGIAAFSLLTPTAVREAREPVLRQLTSDIGLTWFPAISRDGSMLVYSSDRGDSDLNLWLQPVGGRDAIRLTDHPSDDYEPVFSPDGSRIAFRSDRDGGGIYLVPSVGGEAKLIAKEGRRPQFSPDGSRIAYAIDSARFQAGATGSGRIFVVPASGGVPQQLQPNFSSARFPVWTPDAQHVLFLGKKDESPPLDEKLDWWVTPLNGGAAIRTGVFSALRRHKVQIPAFGNSSWVPYGWDGNSVVFPARIGDTDNLWRIGLSSRTWQVASAPQRVTFGAGLEVHASIAADGGIVFTQLRSNYEIAGIGTAQPAARTGASVQMLTTNSAMDHWPALSPDGKRMAFMSWRLGNPDIWLKDLETGREMAMTRAPIRATSPGFTPDGKHIIYHASGDKARAAWRLPLADEPRPDKLCEHCSWMSMTRDGRKLLYADWEPVRLVLRNLDTGGDTEFLRHPTYDLYQPLLTTNDRWIVFYAKLAPERTRIFVAPFRGEQNIPEKDWIPITDGAYHDTAPIWSPKEDVLYFGSNRDGHECIWSQRLDSGMRPAGPVHPVAHFHSAARRLGNLGVVNRALAVSHDRIVFPLEEISGNVWLLRH